MIKENQKLFNIIFAIVGVVLCADSMILAFFIHLHNYQGSYIDLNYYIQVLIYIVPIYFILYHYLDLHNSFRYKSFLLETGKIFQTDFSGIIFIFVLISFLKEVHVSRMVILILGMVSTTLSAINRFTIRKSLHRMRIEGYNLKHFLTVGWNEMLAEFYNKVQSNRELGYDFAGYLSLDKRDAPSRKIKYVDDFTMLSLLLENKSIGEVTISLEWNKFSELGSLIETCEKAGIKSNLLSFYTKYFPTEPYIDEVEDIPPISIRKVPLDNMLNSFAKRVPDYIVSLAVSILISPILVTTTIEVKLTSPGLAIYKRERIDRGKKKFYMYKLRSMKMENDGSDIIAWGIKDDDRRTKFDMLIRKFSTDELPQLISVFKGEMSLVGLRPERPYFVDKFRDEIPFYMLKHLVRPGIIGWAQINGWRGDTPIEERIKCDVYYIENWIFLPDIETLLLIAFKGFINSNEEI